MNLQNGKLLLKKVRLVLTPRSALLRTRLRNGATISGYNRAGYGGRGVYLYGDSLEPELLSLECFLRLGDVFVDVGANVGVYTLKAAREVGDGGLVVAVEPFIGTAYRLSENVRANRNKHVRVRNLCVGRRTEPTRLYFNQNKPNSFSMIPIDNDECISALSITLDDLCRWENLDRLDYLKIDAEGAEAEILEGGAWAIARFRPIIQVEITKRNSVLPLRYHRFCAPASPNNVFIPAEDAEAIETALKLGWVEIK